MAARRTGADDSRCPSCRAPLIRQADVLDIRADAEPIPAGTDADIRGPNRLIWCAPPRPFVTGTPRLRWIHAGHPPDCPHPHHADHHCTTRTPATTLF